MPDVPEGDAIKYHRACALVEKSRQFGAIILGVPGGLEKRRREVGKNLACPTTHKNTSPTVYGTTYDITAGMFAPVR